MKILTHLRENRRAVIIAVIMGVLAPLFLNWLEPLDLVRSTIIGLYVAVVMFLSARRPLRPQIRNKE